MTTADGALTLLEGVNPVPDPDALDISVGADEFLLDLERREHVMTLVDRTSEPKPLPRRTWFLGGVAAAVVAVSVLGGLLVLDGDAVDDEIATDPSTPTTQLSTPTTEPLTPSTVATDSVPPDPADAAIIEAHFAAFNAGDLEAVLATVADDVVASRIFESLAPNLENEPYGTTEEWVQEVAWQLAQGQTLSDPECNVAVDKAATGVTVSCAYGSSDALALAAGAVPIETRTLFVVDGGLITRIHHGYGTPDFSMLAVPFRRWIEEYHPDVHDDLFGGWASREEAVAQGELRAQWAARWARFLGASGCEALEIGCQASAADPAPPITLPPLDAPTAGATIETVVGPIAWTRVDPGSPHPDFIFESDGVFYGPTSSQPDPFTDVVTWWSSPDGVSWTEADIGATGIEAFDGIDVVGDTAWAGGTRRPPDDGPDRSLSRWDGSTFAPVELPAIGPAPGEGLAARFADTGVVAELGGEWVVERSVLYGVQWADLFGVEAPSDVGRTSGPWDGPDFFQVHERRCQNGGCTRSESGRTWTIRPEIVDDERIDFYDDATGELITTVVPPDDSPPIEEVLYSIGEWNGAHTSRELLLVSDDGSTVRRFERPFASGAFATMGDELFALNGWQTDGIELWSTSDLVTWSPRSLPPLIEDVDITATLLGDGDESSLRIAVFDDRRTEALTQLWVSSNGDDWESVSTPVRGTQGPPRLMEFGWFHAGDRADATGLEPWQEREPSFAVSEDGTTWQVIALPRPVAPVESGGAPPDGVEVAAHGDTIFVTFYWGTETERWIARVG